MKKILLLPWHRVHNYMRLQTIDGKLVASWNLIEEYNFRGLTFGLTDRLTEICKTFEEFKITVDNLLLKSKYQIMDDKLLSLL